MTRPEDHTDDLIREALEQDEAELLRGLEDPSVAELLTETFRGRHRRLAVGGAVVNLLLFVAAVYCGVRLLGAEDPRDTILWGVGAVLAFMAVTAIKMWYWMEMNRLAVTREVKRLELQVARLAGRMEASNPPE